MFDWHFRRSPTVWLQYEGETFRPRALWGFGDAVGWRYAHTIVRPWVLISSTLIRMVFLLPLLSYSAGPTAFSSAGMPTRPSKPDTLINAALEDTASSSGNKVKQMAKFDILNAVLAVKWHYKNMPTNWLGKQNAAPLKFDQKPSEAAFSAVLRTSINADWK